VVFDFNQGDRVKHKIFGEGTVLVAQPLANDVMLEISFAAPHGVKKICAGFAKIVKL
jgi:DNA helicase-2/ATP-dependent DNA helicase PcrA